jgi:uncharacterized phage protein (TIGR01671 family)
MNREIKYRAKRKDTGAFIYGWYVECPFGRWPVTPAIIDSELARSGHYEPVEIDAETLGQYTGLRDDSGTEIYEGDIVTGWFDHEKITGNIFYGSDAKFYIERNGLFGIGLNNAQDWTEVIGNIYENPELLEGEHERTD